MQQQIVVDLAQQALLVTLYLAAPLLGLGLLVGLAVSVFQATTQIQEQTLSFVPKIVAVLGAIVVFGPWMLNVITDYTQTLFLNIHTYIN